MGICEITWEILYKSNKNQKNAEILFLFISECGIILTFTWKKLSFIILEVFLCQKQQRIKIAFVCTHEKSNGFTVKTYYHS